MPVFTQTKCHLFPDKLPILFKAQMHIYFPHPHNPIPNFFLKAFPHLNKLANCVKTEVEP